MQASGRAKWYKQQGKLGNWKVWVPPEDIQTL